MLGRRIIAAAVILTSVVVADSNAEAGRRHGHRYSGHHHYRSYHYRPYRPYRHFGLGFGIAALGIHYAIHDASPRYYTYHRDRPVYAEIETDIEPSSAAVYVDGDAVGIADDFNGWPTKLRVEPGAHVITFREPGYEPLVFEVDVLAYHKMRLKERMLPGDDRMPETAVSTPPLARTRPPAATRQPTTSLRGDLGGRSGLILIVDPPDSSVYVDGVLVEERSGALQRYVISLEPGAYRIEVTKPGYRVFTGDVTLRDRQRQELTVRLDRPES